MSSRARKKKTAMNGNSLGVVLSPGGLAVAERSGGERSEPQRSGATGKPGADSGAASRPNPEVVAKAKRRTYTAEYKQRILEEAEVAAATRGAVGALLRREGLYSSLLATWRRERASGIHEALTPQRRGPKCHKALRIHRRQSLQRLPVGSGKRSGRIKESGDRSAADRPIPWPTGEDSSDTHAQHSR